MGSSSSAFFSSWDVVQYKGISMPGGTMKKLMVYLKEYRKEAIISPLFKLLEAVLELLVPLVMAAMIDRGIAQRDVPYVLRMGFLLLTCGGVGLAVSLVAQYYAAKAAVGFSTKLRQALFVRIQQLSYTQLDGVGIPTLLTRITTDVNQVQTGVNMTLRLLLRSPFVVFGAMGMAFAVDGRVALIFVALIPLLGLVVWAIMAWTLPGYEQAQGRLDKVLLRTRETLTGVRVIRAFAKEEGEIADFVEEHDGLTQMQIRVSRISALLNPMTYVLVNVALLALMWSGGLRVDGGLLTQGGVVALVNYLSQILVELIKLANLILTITKGVASARRVSQVLEIQPDKMETRERGISLWDAVAFHQKGRHHEAVTFEHVSMCYAGAGADALTDISFEVTPGQRVGVIGGTGSGKTTLVNLIPRFYDASQGVVWVGGQDVRDQDIAELRSHIAVVPQQATLFSGSIRENLLWGNENATEKELWLALEMAQAADVVRGKPQGLEEWVEHGGRNLSGGQRQRLTIARALVKKPDILILDDSASSLDFATEAALRQALQTLEGKVMVFVVSQRVSTVRSADLILVLEDGRLVGSGTHSALLSISQVYREIFASQHPGEVGA